MAWVFEHYVKLQKNNNNNMDKDNNNVDITIIYSTITTKVSIHYLFVLSLVGRVGAIISFL